MKLARTVSLALAISAGGASAYAAQEGPHKDHHPVDAASAPTSKPMAAKAGSDMNRMDSQMKVMGQMHDKMMAAKTPEERNALMADHMKAMQEGMSMMKDMPPGSMKGGTTGDMAARHQGMEKRMEMMQATMQMMMDRLPTAPAN